MSIRLASSFQKSPALLGAEEHPHLAIKVTPIASSGAARRPFHLALELDVSGSMEGARIDAVKRTMGLLLDALTDGDVLTIISYQSVANILARATVVDAGSRATLRTIVDGLHADGGTNLEAALAALRTVTTTAGVPPVDAVFVLTDGHINQGLTAASGLTRLLTAAIPLGTPVYTLGFGADHNSRMLRDMALRTRGSYTYADADELIPATIADIISGLATEVGRGSRLILPAGWTCLELTAEVGADEFSVGVLVADKEQWIVLKGPAGPLTAMPTVSFVWRSHDGVEHTEALTSFSDFDSLLVEEQYCRCRVATVQTTVQDMLESHRIPEARDALRALGAELDASPAKDRTFVISLRAQVDEMVDALSHTAATPSPFAAPPLMRGGLPRQSAFGWGAAGVPAPPALAPVLSRMASNTAALGVQRGILSHVASSGRGGSGAPHGITHTFSSPSQRQATAAMTERYSQVPTGAAPTADPDEESAAYEDAMAAILAATTTPEPAAAGAGATSPSAVPAILTSWSGAVGLSPSTPPAEN